MLHYSLSIMMDSAIVSYLRSALTGVLVLVLLYCYFLTITKKGKANSKNKRAPEPAGGWPIIGHLQLLTGPQLHHKTLGDTADKYGPIFTVRLGVNPALVVSSWELAKELFVNNNSAITSRPPITAAKYLAYNFAMVSFAPQGPFWREMRKITISELFSRRRLDQFKELRIDEVETSLKELYRHWTEKKIDCSTSGQVAVVVDLKQWLSGVTLNVIIRTVAGKRYYGATTLGEDEINAKRWQKALRKSSHYLGNFVVRDGLPFLGWLDIGGHEKEMKRTAQDIDGILEEWLEERKRKRNIDISGEAVGDDQQQYFMDAMLSVLEGRVFDDCDTDTANKALCLNMIAAGGDTTMITMTWAISLLLNNSHEMVKVQEELDKYVGKERLVNEADISNLVYLRAVVKETLRLYPAVPLLARKFTEDCTIGSYHVPKGTWLLLNIWKIQRDTNIWQNPSEFKPERFLSTHKNVDVRGKNFELIPFGSGRRICPGISIALNMIHLTLATLLQRFHISTDPANSPVDMTESSGLTNHKATSLEVLLSPRLPPALYD